MMSSGGDDIFGVDTDMAQAGDDSGRVGRPSFVAFPAPCLTDMYCRSPHAAVPADIDQLREIAGRIAAMS